MPLPRVRLRTLMIVVAAAAGLAWAGRMLHWSAVYRERARTYWWMVPPTRLSGPGSPP